MRANQFVCTLVALALSGCVGSAGSQHTPPATSASFTLDTGGIDGVVITEEYEPIAGAQVAILQQGLNANSSTDGHFAFSQLAPGKYSLVAAALGYFQASATADVAAGKVAKTTIILQRVPVSEPAFDVVWRYSGTLTASDTCNVDGGHPRPETKDIAWTSHPLPVNATKDDGTTLAAVNLVVELKSVDDPATIDVDMYLVGPKGNNIASGTNFDPNERIEWPKYMPPGAYQIIVWLCTAARTTYAVKATITYEQGEVANYIRERGKV